MSGTANTPGTTTVKKPEQALKRPPRFRVILHNDHYTTMDFVVEILEFVFHKSAEESVRVMLNVHERGVGVAGEYAAEIAETKVTTVHSLAKDRGFPLKCTMEPV